MKKTLRLLAGILAVMLVCGIMASCSKSNTAADTKTTESSAEQKTEETVSAQQDDEVDYSDIALTIEDGDFEAMEQFLDAWANNTYDGKVIKITGVSQRRMSNCTVSEKNGEGLGRGCSWEIIDGNFPDDYPAEDAKVTLVGVLTVTNEYGARALLVPKENVTVLE